MRLYLAVAVLMLAFLAYTEAQEDETLQQRLAVFGGQLTELGQNVAEKARDTFAQFQNSDFAVSARNYFQEHFEKIKSKLEELSN